MTIGNCYDDSTAAPNPCDLGPAATGSANAADFLLLCALAAAGAFIIACLI